MLQRTDFTIGIELAFSEFLPAFGRDIKTIVEKDFQNVWVYRSFHVPDEDRQEFWKVSSLLIVPCDMTVELTFENFYLRRSVRVAAEDQGLYVY